MAIGVARMSENVTAELDLNDGKIMDALRSAFAESNLAMLPLFDREFSRKKWDWPVRENAVESIRKPTGRVSRDARIRYNRRVRMAKEGSPRDIVDTGILRQSYGQSVELAGRDGLQVLHNWNTRYALAVHNGYRLRNGRQMPARPWTKEPLERFTKIFEDYANRFLGQGS